ncbi:arylsulfatase [Desulforhopalus singaporensis]|uniref:Arylsulfatase n=1 Tax=Desulforhopalus singaporensis TaxID=91360 RepID=A0A1H0VN51_9BACT|nr:arylsulfatase [Desulforhopalus singaporensis]SDP79850.1 arylsulfatase [Desulforhopalus singaporensis]
MDKKEFKGSIGRYFDESTPYWHRRSGAPENAPNILFIVLDDVGYGQLSCYGSDIATPNLDRLATEGLQYTNFHTAAMCSPTRSCLLTGRNHHTNGMGCLAEYAMGYPGYDARIPKENGFLSEILSMNGYACYALGKWHLAPEDETNMASTKKRWPLGRGFERFYGFLGGHTDQYEPNLISDNHYITPPKSFAEGYHLNEDLADKAIEFVTDLKNIDPEKPFFMYYALGAMHAPHQAPQEWIDKYKGKFDQGWEKWRQEVYQRQLDTGVIPPGTELPPRPEWIQDWETLSDDEKRLYARFMEVFAGFFEHTDYHIGRVIDFLKNIGQYDNTMIILVSDNGASSEGGPHGSINEACLYNSVAFTVEENMKMLDKLGGPESYPNYPWGWTWAGNTPLKRWKRETHEGGVADPMIVNWPAGITTKGEKRRQYCHAIDLVPTVLEVLGLNPPKSIDGTDQSPIEGTGFAYTFENGESEGRHLTQYYEMAGCRAIYHNGWKAVAWHNIWRLQWESANFDDDQWELYHVAEDFSESRDLSEQFPDKLRELQDLWWAEAGRYNVLPLDNRMAQRVLDFRSSHENVREEYVYYPYGAPVAEGAAVDTKNRSHEICAEVEMPPDGAEGVLLAHGGRYGGYTFYVKDRKLHYVYNFLNLQHHHMTSETEIPEGPCVLKFQYEKTGVEKLGAGGVGRLFIDGRQVAQVEIPRTMGIRYHLADDGLCCGYDGQTPVTEDYRSPFKFTGKLNRVVVTTSGERYYDQELQLKVAKARQ